MDENAEALRGELLACGEVPRLRPVVDILQLMRIGLQQRRILRVPQEHPLSALISREFQKLRLVLFIKDDRMIDILEMAEYDYVVDAIDTLAPKIFLIYHSLQKGYRVVSCMGAGGKMDPEQIRIADISKSYNCNLARMLRKRLHKLGVYKGVKVVFSPEEVDPEAVVLSESENKKSNVGTISYMPPLFGCFCASVVIRDITGK